MDFSEYKSKFIPLAKKEGYTDREIASLLERAENMMAYNVPVIYNQEHFANLVGIKLPYLLSMANSPRKFYKHFKIPKKNGKYRKIEQPLPTLQKVQYWILDNILNQCYKQFIHPAATAFVPGVSLADNLKPHVGKSMVVALDLKDFFTSVPFHSVFDLFSAMGYNNSVVMLLSKLCTYQCHLPQGAPTSPMLSNMVFAKLDNNIARYCDRRNYTYTRYADDLTFSGDEIKVKLLIRYLQMILGFKKYEINEEKTKIMGQGNAQYVTGCTVNHKANAPRRYREKIRQEIFHLQTKGIEFHFSKVKGLPPHIQTPESYINHLLGKVFYVLQIIPNDKEFLGYRDYLKLFMEEVENNNGN